MAIDEEKCKQCIWHNDETGDCEGTLTNHGRLEVSPFYKAHPEIKPRLNKGLGEDDCIGMEYRPELTEVT